MNTAPGTLRASADEPQPALLAPENLAEVRPSLLETRIGPSAFFGATRTEPLSFVSGTSNRACGDGPAEIAMGSSGPSIDEPLALYASGAVSYLNADGLGSVVATNNTAGAVSHSAVFDAWGVAKSETGTRIHSFTYTGREIGEAGLNFYRARHYQSGVGRFSQEDPLGFEAGPSFFAYVRSNPMRSVDPFGLDANCTWNISTHTMTCTGDNGTQFSTSNGRSGNGACMNNPACQAVPNQGPIPTGNWNLGQLGNTPNPHPVPRVPISPTTGTNNQGRTDLQIHQGGPNASQGCVVLDPATYQQFRQFYQNSGNAGTLVVTP